MDIVSVIICILGLGELVLLSLWGIKFRNYLGDFQKVEHRENRYEERLKPGGNIENHSLTRVEFDRTALEELRKKYHEDYSWYVVFSQLVALFPLMGIFGTVLGLVMGGDLADVDQLVSGLTTALQTTLTGLVCSIFLKTLDAFFPGKLVTDLDSRFERVDAEIERQSLENILKG